MASLPFDGNGASLKAKTDAVVAIVAETGSPFDVQDSELREQFDQHPRADQRALCAAKGISSGLLMIRLRQIAMMREPMATTARHDTMVLDPDMYALRSDLWVWSRKNSESIVSAILSDKARVLTAKDYEKIAVAAEGGRRLLAVAGAAIPDAPPFRCSTQSSLEKSVTTCKAQLLDSVTLEYSFFDAVRGTFAPVLQGRGWIFGSRRQTSEGISESFSKGSATIQIEASYVERVVRFSVSSSSP